MFQLAIQQGEPRGHTYPVKDGAVIGRLATCAIPLRDQHASRQNARIALGPEGEFYIEDMGSTCGTLLNGQKVTKARLAANDLITIGETVLRVVEAGASSVPPPVVAAPMQALPVPPSTPQRRPVQASESPRPSSAPAKRGAGQKAIVLTPRSSSRASSSPVSGAAMPAPLAHQSGDTRMIDRAQIVPARPNSLRRWTPVAIAPMLALALYWVADAAYFEPRAQQLLLEKFAVQSTASLLWAQWWIQLQGHLVKKDNRLSLKQINTIQEILPRADDSFLGTLQDEDLEWRLRHMDTSLALQADRAIREWKPKDVLLGLRALQACVRLPKFVAEARQIETGIDDLQVAEDRLLTNESNRTVFIIALAVATGVVGLVLGLRALR